MIYDAPKKLHYEQQPAMGYPSFPGNIEALSLPTSPPGLYSSHSTLSSSSSSATTTPVSPPLRSTTLSQTPDASNDSSKPRRRQTLAACRPCRKRKSRVCLRGKSDTRALFVFSCNVNNKHLTDDLSVTVPVRDAIPA